MESLMAVHVKSYDVITKLQDKPNDILFAWQLMLCRRHFHGFPIPIRMIFRSGQVRITLASRAIVHDLMAEYIAIDTEMILASFAFVPARLAGTFGTFWARSIARAAVGAIGGGWERSQAAETLRRVLLASSLPGDFDPIAEREEMVVGTCQVCGQDECQVACWACGRQVADFGFAARAQVATAVELAVAGAEGGFFFGDARREAHHQECGLVAFLGFCVGCAHYGWCGDSH